MSHVPAGRFTLFWKGLYDQVETQGAAAKRQSLALLRSAQRLSSSLPERWDRRLREAGKILVNYRGERSLGMKMARFTLASRRSELLLAPFGDGCMLVSTRDLEIGRSVYVRGEFERIYMKVALDYLRENAGFSPTGKGFIDVGANIGTSTVDALLHFGFRSAWSFEPEPANFKLLRINILLNDLGDRVHTDRLTISNEDGTALLLCSPGNSGDHRILRRTDGEDNGASPVPCRTIDSLVAEGAIDPSRAGLLWCDTQGHEPFVLAGATSLLEEQGVPVVAEYWPSELRNGDALEMFEDQIARSFAKVVDLRMLSHGVRSDAVLDAAQVGRLRQRYRGRDVTDLLLIQ